MRGYIDRMLQERKDNNAANKPKVGLTLAQIADAAEILRVQNFANEPEISLAEITYHFQQHELFPDATPLVLEDENGKLVFRPDKVSRAYAPETVLDEIIAKGYENLERNADKITPTVLINAVRLRMELDRVKLLEDDEFLTAIKDRLGLRKDEYAS